jgi:hypothetical protein
MPILKTGQIFSSGDQVTSQKLMDIADLATFEEPADGSTIIVNNETYGVPSGDGKLKVPANGITGNELLQDASDNNNRAVTTDHIKDSNITTAKIADDAVDFTKLRNIDTYKVIGRTTGGTGDSEQVDIKDENDLGSNANDALATQSSIKAYVDAVQPIGKYGFRVLDAKDDLFFYDQLAGGSQIRVDKTNREYYYQADQGDSVMVTITISPSNTDGGEITYTDPVGNTVIVGSYRKGGTSGHGYNQAATFAMYPGSSFVMPTIKGTLKAVAVLKQS